MKNNFPKDFLWGASISAYQAEGAIQEDGKVLSIADLSTRDENGNCTNAISSDFYHHYKEDIRLMGEMGAKVFRFSLAWPRIMPEQEGVRNEAGIRFYHQVLDELEKYGITPVVTLFHYDLPVTFQERYGGWQDRRTVDAYMAFVRICFEEFGGRIHHFLTINEPDILFMYGGHGLDLDGRDKWKKDRLKINHNFALAHARAVNLCHEMLPDAKVGPVFGYVPVYAESCRPLDKIAAMNISERQNHFFQELFLNGRYVRHILEFYGKESELPEITEEDEKLLRSAHSDFIALNYYKSDVAKWCEEEARAQEMQGNVGGKKGTCVYPKVPGCYELCANPYLERTDWDWEIDPTGIRVMLREVYQNYYLPILITENGVACHEHSEGEEVQDDARIAYLDGHIRECGKAIEDGVELMGYCVWSFLDLMSTGHGAYKRYGLVYVDYETEERKRIPKKSYRWYKELIENYEV